MKELSYEVSINRLDYETSSLISTLYNGIVTRETERLLEEYYYKNANEPRKGCYRFIPQRSYAYNFVLFRALREIILKERLQKLNEKKGTSYQLSSACYGAWPWPVDDEVKFVDAGCGVGNIMLIANYAGLSPHGIEYDANLVKMARKFLGGRPKITNGDILKHGKRWKKYDIVYFYCPMCDAKMEQRFEESMENQIKVGTFIVAHLKKSNRYYHDKRFARVEISDPNNESITRNSSIVLRKIKS
jgi:hypothetical protein